MKNGQKRAPVIYQKREAMNDTDEFMPPVPSYDKSIEEAKRHAEEHDRFLLSVFRPLTKAEVYREYPRAIEVLEFQCGQVPINGAWLMPRVKIGVFGKGGWVFGTDARGRLCCYNEACFGSAGRACYRWEGGLWHGRELDWVCPRCGSDEGRRMDWDSVDACIHPRIMLECRCGLHFLASQEPPVPRGKDKA